LQDCGRGGCLYKRREYWLISGKIASFAAIHRKESKLGLLTTLNRATLAAFVGGLILH
jgi:hypothetical protein